MILSIFEQPSQKKILLWIGSFLHAAFIFSTNNDTAIL